jgi:hypothetical protein
MNDKKRPKTIDDLADEGLEGFEGLLCPATYQVIHDLLCDLYTSHPVMSRLAEEALSESNEEAQRARASCRRRGPLLS